MLHVKFTKGNKTKEKQSRIYLIDNKKDISNIDVNEKEKRFLENRLSEKNILVELNRYDYRIYILMVPGKGTHTVKKEKLRQGAFELTVLLRKNREEKMQLIDYCGDNDFLRSFIEGLILSLYRFDKYITGKKSENKKDLLKEVLVFSENLSDVDLEELLTLMEAVYYARDMVNEPASWLNAVRLSESFKQMGDKAGFRVEILHKQKIESLRMGGLLAVNKGSIDPPTFSILEWAPEQAVNKDPVVLVGKGVVFDTGGLSLKPTKDSMDTMKSDMAGGAAVASAIYALAKNKIPCHVIGLIPATDNRPDGNAYAPGDVITMYDGTTVEVLNTDAEGRMILADALAYAKYYKPELVVELSTLTGAAAVAIGKYGLVAMGTAPEEMFFTLEKSGENVFERVVRFPFWDEYKELLKSEIADLKNIGGRHAGAITAGKFLEHFTDYPYIHLDIAGPAFIQEDDSYRGKGATGVGVRLLYDFVKDRCRL